MEFAFVSNSVFAWLSWGNAAKTAKALLLGWEKERKEDPRCEFVSVTQVDVYNGGIDGVVVANAFVGWNRFTSGAQPSGGNTANGSQVDEVV